MSTVTTSATLSQDQIDGLIRSQLGIDPAAPVAPNPLVAVAEANSAASVAMDVVGINQNLQYNYTVGFNNWAAQVTAGRIDPAAVPPPAPPNAMIAAKASDGWTYMVTGPDPVCPPLPVPAVTAAAPPPAYVPAVGQAVQAPAGVNYAAGYKFTEMVGGTAMGFVVEQDTTPWGSVVVWRRTS